MILEKLGNFSSYMTLAKSCNSPQLFLVYKTLPALQSCPENWVRRFTWESFIRSSCVGSTWPLPCFSQSRHPRFFWTKQEGNENEKRNECSKDQLGAFSWGLTPGTNLRWESRWLSMLSVAKKATAMRVLRATVTIRPPPALELCWPAMSGTQLDDLYLVHVHLFHLFVSFYKFLPQT